MIETLNKKLEDIEYRYQQALANLQALQGAKQVILEMLQEENAKAEQTENEIKE